MLGIHMEMRSNPLSIVLQRQAGGDPNQQRTVQLCSKIVASCDRRLQVSLRRVELAALVYKPAIMQFLLLLLLQVCCAPAAQLKLTPHVLRPAADLQAVAEEKAAEEAAKRAAPVPLAGRLLLLVLAVLYVVFAYRIKEVSQEKRSSRVRTG